MNATKRSYDLKFQLAAKNRRELMTVDAIVAECYGCLSVVYYNNNTSAILLLGKTLFAFSFFVHYVFIVGEE